MKDDEIRSVFIDLVEADAAGLKAEDDPVQEWLDARDLSDVELSMMSIRLAMDCGALVDAGVSILEAITAVSRGSFQVGFEVAARRYAATIKEMEQ